MTREMLTADGAGDLSMVGRMFDGRRLVRALGSRGPARRYLGHDERRRIDCLVYVFDALGVGGPERLWASLRSVVGQRRPHVLPIEEIGRERGGLIWAITPYPGNHESIVTLDGLRRSKGGRFSVHETCRAVEQLLDAVSAAHHAGLVHGEISGEEVIVNPRGTLLVELYGLRRALEPAGSVDEARREEVRSIVSLAWTLLTGYAAEEVEVFAPQARRLIDTRWMRWIERGLDPINGFETATEAIAALPDGSSPAVEFPAGRARSLLGRLSWAVASRKENPGPPMRKKQGEDRI